LGVALQDEGFSVTLLCFEVPETLIDRAEQFGLVVKKRSVMQADEGLGADVLTFSNRGDVVVFDGYFFDYRAIAEVHQSDRFVVVIDDNGDLAESASHLIVNQNLHANKAMYCNNRYEPRLMLGCEWALIRSEVGRVRDSVQILERRGVFIAMGGTDPLEITPKISSRLVERTGLPVVAAGGFLGGSTLSPLEMAQQMSRAQIGVIACGTTTWEALCLGLPIVGVVVADNQVGVAKSLRENDFGDFIDCRSEIEVEKILTRVSELLNDKFRCQYLSKRGSSLVDGQGARRVASVISLSLS
jgi:spore coat polysaccharide biosynthesis predicted glycosyltransferase SpsG